MIKIKEISGGEFKAIYTALLYDQQSIAAELGYNPRQVRRWEREGTPVPRSVVLALAAVAADHKKLIKKSLQDVFAC